MPVMKILAARILAKKKTQGQPNFVGVVVPHPFARESSFKTITKGICFNVLQNFFVFKIICLCACGEQIGVHYKPSNIIPVIPKSGL